MAAKLRTRFQGDCIFVRKPVELEMDRSYNKTHQPEELLLAYGAVADRGRKKAAYRPKSIKPIVAKSYVTVFTGIVAVLKSLRKHGTVTMSELYAEQPRSREVATFLAILELSKQGRIIISEDGNSIRMATRADLANKEDENEVQ